MARTLHILATCTKRKTADIPPRLMLRNVGGTTVLARAERWLRLVSAPACPTAEAGRLYCGDHWSIARSLVTAAARRGFEPRLWVISTGYGLIPAEARIAPYSATFSPTHKDSVGAGAEAFAQWWGRLSQWPGPEPGTPRTVAALARSDPRAAMLVVASEAYLSAVRADVEKAAEAMADPERLVIISAGTKRPAGLDRYLLPVDARLQAALGGARRTLNVRMARRVLEECPPAEFRASALADRYRRLLDAQPALVPARRSKSTDADVADFVSQALARRDARASATRLLKLYRGSGRACEQWRFKRIFEQVAARRDAERGAVPRASLPATTAGGNS